MGPLANGSWDTPLGRNGDLGLVGGGGGVGCGGGGSAGVICSSTVYGMIGKISILKSRSF